MKVLVTGAAGFLGQAVAEELLAAGHEVTTLSRRPQSELGALGARTVSADLLDLAALECALQGQEGVVHAAAKTGVWGDPKEYWQANVEGTRNVLAASARLGIERLVYTSSPSVCFDGKDQRMAGNDLPYARRFLCAYQATKAQAEREVLAASGRGQLITCALRPHLIVGARDPHLVPRLIHKAKAGKLRVVGDGRNEVSLTFVENAAYAHRLALEQLAPKAPHAGRAYFVAQETPVLLWDWIGELLLGLGVPWRARRVPLPAALAAAAILEGCWKLFGLAQEPPLTRFVALQLARAHSYDLLPLRRDLGYTERVDLATGTEHLLRALRR